METPERLHCEGQAGRRVSLSGRRPERTKEKERKKREEPEGEDGLRKRLDGELGNGRLCLRFVRHAT